MTREPSPRLSADEVLGRIRTELDSSDVIGPERALENAIAGARGRQRDYRVQPVGGRLLLFKKIVHWFVASTFDRQAKVVEDLLQIIEDLEGELSDVRAEVRDLRAETAALRRTGSGVDQ